MTNRRSEGLRLRESAFIFSLAFFLCAELGRQLSSQVSPYASFWLPAGLYVGVLLLNETRHWHWFVLAAAPANFLFDHLLGTPFITTVGFYLANTAEAVTGAWLVRTFVAEKPELATLREFFGLLVCSAVFSSILGSTIAVADLTVCGMSQSFWGSWFTWWGNQAMAILLVTPFLLAWFRPVKAVDQYFKQPGRIFEATLLAAVLVWGTWYLLVQDKGIDSPYKSRLMPLLLWAGLRFGLRGVTLANLLMAILTGFFTNHFLKGLSHAEIVSGDYVTTIQSFLAISVAISLIPTIIVEDRNRKILELRASEERFRQLTHAAFEGICISENGRVLNINDQGLRMFGYQRDEMIGQQITDMVAPESRAMVTEAVRNSQEVAYEHKLLRKDGSVFCGEAQAKMVRVGDRTLRMTALRDISERKLAEAALKQSEERFSRIFKNSPIPISLIRLDDGVFLDANESFVRMSGFTREEIIGNTALGLNVYPDPSRRAVIMEQVRKHGYLHAHEQQFRTKSGRIRDHRLWLDVIAISGEQCMLVLALDITEQKLAEEKSKTREHQYHSLFEHMLGGFIVLEVLFDADGQPADHRLLQANSGFEEMTGLRRDEEVGRTSAELTFKWPAEVARRYYQVALDGEPLHCERFNESLQRWYDIRVFSPQKGQFAMVFYEITARKDAQDSNARLAKVIEQTSETIVITDIAGTILYVNPAFEKITGYSFAEAVGQNPRLLKSDQHDAGFYRQMWEVLQRGEVWRGHFINRRKDGTLYEEDAIISPISDGAGNVINYVAVKRDVTREMRLETELRQSQKMEAIGQLAGGVAHDFNNILSALLMQTDLVSMSGNVPAEVQAGLHEIRNDVNRATELTRQLLLLGRRQVMQMRLLNLNELIMNLGRMLQRVIREDVQLQLHLHPSPLMTRADAGMLEQVLMNLSVNARDAMPGGGQLDVETSEYIVDESNARLHPEAAQGRFACLSVSDTGGGIPAEIMPRIFEPFFTTKEPGKGTGLGLATVFGIVKQHRGWITVDNRPGQGVTFQVFFPVSREAVPEPAPVPAKAKPRGGTETILLVEDEPAVRRLARKFLEQHGYQVLEAADGLQALNCWSANRGRIALLLTDLVMPGGLDGQVLARRLLAEEPQIKVVYTSGYSPDIAGRDFQLRPGEAFIQKPFATDDFLETVRRSLDG